MNLLRASLLGLTALALACTGAPEGTSGPTDELTTGTSPLEGTFEDAGRAYQVPVGLLKAIAYVETRVNPKAQKSAFGGWGTMHLVEREDWDALSRAAKLVGQDRGRLMVDPEANIHGAAALLRALADDSFRKYPDLHPSDPGAFFHAVSLMPGFASAPMAAEYAKDVFRALEDGFTVENADGTVVQAPTWTSWRDYAPLSATQSAAKEYPGAYQWKASPNYSAGRSSYTYVVIHTVQGSYSGCISWFQNTNSNVSAHYVVRSSDGQVTQMVEHKDTAWHAGCYNNKSIGIEHEGYVAEPSRWYTDAMYAASAKLTRYIADRHAIPRTRSRIIGHVEVAAECNKNRHYDPGTGWNWTKYMNLVNGTTTTTTTGKINGVIYQNGSSSNPVSGATVTAGGKTVTTGTNGSYEFVLAPGSYAVNVSKTGYSSNSVTRTVTAGATVWGSMEINQAAVNGTLIGFMYYGTDPADTTKRLSGVSVSVPGKTAVTTGTDGRYQFSLAPGTYTISASKAGYHNTSITRSVTANTTSWGSMPMTATTTTPPPDTTLPTVEVTYPPHGEQLDHAEITLSGTADDNVSTLTSVKVSVNGGTAATVPVTGGKYSQILKLSPGANTIVVSATDGANNKGEISRTATFNPGVQGRVFTFDEAGEEEVPLEGATVELIDPETSDVAATTTTDAQGRYLLITHLVNRSFIVAARLEGYATSGETAEVPDDQRITVDLPLTHGSNVPSEVGVSFLDPSDGATTDGAEITVYGRVDGMLVAAVLVNGVGADIIGVDSFGATVPLDIGVNEIVAEARGVDGEVVTARMSVTRNSPANGQTGGAVPTPGEGTKSLAPAKGGCAAVTGLELFALLALAPLVRRRRK